MILFFQAKHEVTGIHKHRPNFVTATLHQRVSSKQQQDRTRKAFFSCDDFYSAHSMEVNHLEKEK